MSFLLNPYSYGGNLPLAAYAFDYIYPGYAGDVIEVRRSSDNALETFTPTEVIDGTLTTFTGAGDGFVRTMYDQSGNGYHRVQTTDARQPYIVQSGVLKTLNSKPALYQPESTSGLARFLSTPVLPKNATFAMTCRINADANGQYCLLSRSQLTNVYSGVANSADAANGIWAFNFFTFASWNSVNVSAYTRQQFYNLTYQQQGVFLTVGQALPYTFDPFYYPVDFIADSSHSEIQIFNSDVSSFRESIIQSMRTRAGF